MKNINNNFLWGVVNIGQQTEGHDNSSSWSQWSSRGLVPKLGIVNDYWNRFEGDHDIVQSMGCNAMRITIEWSRVEPHEDEFDANAIEKYRKILTDLKSRNITACVGLWHWSVPLWFEKKYGMHNKLCVDKFHKFSQYVRDELGDLIDCVVVLNEPNVYLTTSYATGMRPPFFKDPIKRMCVAKNLIRMHKKTYDSWKMKYPKIMIGSTLLYNHESGAQNTIIQNTYIFLKRYFSVNFLINRLVGNSDYIGINYYTSDKFFFGKSGEKWGVHGTNDWHSPDVWKTFPEGLYHILMKVKKYQKPIMILENGKPTNAGKNDNDRQAFLEKSIFYMKKAMEEGADVHGYFHYSLCDSYEWDSGYDFKFGLVEIDRKTLERKKRKSCNVFRDIIQSADIDN